MKNEKVSGLFPHRRGLMFAASIFLGFSLPLTASPAPESSAGPNYQFFMGTDVQIPFNDANLPMVDYRNNSAILLDGGETVSRDFSKVKQVRLVRAPKLSRDLVVVSGFEAKGTVSPDNSGVEQMMQIMLIQDKASDVQRFAESTTSALASFSEALKNPNVTPPDFTPQIDRTMNISSDPGQHMGAPVNEVDQMPRNDAIDICFNVSAQEPVNDAYVLVVALIRESLGDDTPHQWVRFERIGRLGPAARSVHITQSGLPKGFVIDETSLFFFTHGEEIANSLSSKRISVSTDEARLILNTDYIASNHNTTRPPTLAISTIPDSIIARLKNSGVDREAVLHLDVEAQVTSAECGGKPVSEEALDLLRTILFHPGLKEGKAVPASVRIDVSQFSKSKREVTTHQ